MYGRDTGSCCSESERGGVCVPYGVFFSFFPFPFLFYDWGMYSKTVQHSSSI